MIKKTYIKPLYYVAGLGLLLLIAGALTYPKTKQSYNNQNSQSKEEPKEELERIVSPVGVARFIRIEILDKTYREEGEYTLSLELEDTPETQEYLKKISSEIEKFKISEEARLGRTLTLARLPWRMIPVESKEGEIKRLTGDQSSNSQVYLVKYRELGSFKYKGDKVYTKIFKFGLDGKPHKGQITPNSKVKVSADIILFNNVYGIGASLRLKAVQLIELGDTESKIIPEDFGFISEEWGGTNDPKPTPSPTPSPEILKN